MFTCHSSALSGKAELGLTVHLGLIALWLCAKVEIPSEFGSSFLTLLESLRMSLAILLSNLRRCVVGLFLRSERIALWVQVTLVVCYLPAAIVVALTPQRGISTSTYLNKQFTISLVFLNSSLNPLLYCWKIREVRQAVKEILRGLSCSSN